jgi:hypothetical protein
MHLSSTSADNEAAMATMKAEHEVLVALDPELEAIKQEIDRLAREGRIPDPNDQKGDD